MGLTYASMLIVTGFAWFWFYGLVRLVRDIALTGNAATLIMLGILAYLRAHARPRHRPPSNHRQYNQEIDSGEKEVSIHGDHE